MRKNGETCTNRFAQGVFFLTLSNLLTKLCGLFLKVPLTNTLGDTGMAYFNLAYAVYKWFYMISTAGLPVAAAVLTAQYRTEPDPLRRQAMLLRVRNVTLGAFCIMGGVGSLCMWVGAPLFARLQGVEDAAAPIAAVAPALFFICIASALRGWYQGLEDQLPASAAQVAEAGAKMLCGLLLGAYALRRGLKISIAAAYAITGLTVGSFLGMAVMLLSMRAVKRRCGMRAKIPDRINGLTPGKTLLLRLLRTALPVTLSASVLSLCDMLDSMIVIRRLCSGGMAEAEALRLYGSYTALAVPMFNLPPVLIYPVTTALIPLLSAEYKDRGGPRRCHRLIRVSLSGAACIALPCSAGMSVLAEPILRLFYREDLAATGAPLLAVLALAIFFLSVLAMTNAILQALECARLPLYSMLAGAAVKLLSSWILTGQTEIGIFGTPISTVLCYLTMAVCNLYFVMRVSGVSLPFVRLFAKPAAASVFCAVTAKAVYVLTASAGILPEQLCTLGAVGVGAVTYLSALVLLRGMDEELWQLLPGRLVRRRTEGDAQRRVAALSWKQKRSSALSKRR